MATGQAIFSSPFDIVELVDGTGIQRLITEAKESGYVAIDTETLGLRWAKGELPFMSMFAANTQRAYFTYREDALTEAILVALEDAGVELRFWNAKFDLHMEREGVGWEPCNGYRELKYTDGMLLQRVVSPNTSAKLKIASQIYTPEESMIDVDGPKKKVKAWLAEHTQRERIGGKYIITKRPNYGDVPVDIMVPYGCQDVVLTNYSIDGLEPVVNASPTLKRTAEREMKLCSVVLDMERVGWPVNRCKLMALISRAEAILAEELAKFNAAVGPEYDVNPFSSPALAEYLYNVRKYNPGIHRTEKGNPSTDDAALRDLPDADVREPLLKLRKWKKRLDKANEFLEYITDSDRVNTVYNQSGARTGRFTSEAPGMHNTERPDPDDPETSPRDCVEARPGYSLLFVDYSAIEMRLFAHYSRDAVLVKAFVEGLDAHLMVAAMMYGLPMESVSKIQRTFAKTLSFTILYGGGKKRVKDALMEGAGGNEPMTRAEAVVALAVLRPGLAGNAENIEFDVFMALSVALVATYKAAFPSVQKFTDRAKNAAMAREKLEGQGYVTNFFGRRVFIAPGKGFVATNALIQSSAADLMKEAMIRVDDCLRLAIEDFQKLDGSVLFFGQIHDELIFEVRDDLVQFVAQTIKPLLTDWPEISVPLEVEFSVAPHGTSWARKEKLALDA